MGKVVTVSERDLLRVLKKFRDLRAWAVRARMDPWAFRQGLLLGLHLDTVAALQRGVPRENLQTFDALVEANAAETQLSKFNRRLRHNSSKQEVVKMYEV